MSTVPYDIIGDIHGYSGTLKALLQKLGYAAADGVHRHPDRRVIFLGDFIDRGPGQREVIDIVRPMVESGTALAVMGNHEFNAIAFATPEPNGAGFLREHSPKNCNQHGAFLEEYAQGSPQYDQTIAWFRTLPLWLDLEDIRVIHACWDRDLIRKLQDSQHGSSHLSQDLLIAACDEDKWQYQAIETILKGKEISLPDGKSFADKDGNHRHEIRVRWWDQEVRTYRDAFMGPPSALAHIPEDPIDANHLLPYAHGWAPVFLGHYWLEGEPAPLAPNIACLDYSVAKPGGALVAYRWDGERTLASEKFVRVPRLD